MPARRLPLAVASPFVLVLACAIDLLAIELAPGAMGLGALLALCVALGALHGALWDLGFALLARAPAWLAGATWLAVCAGAALWLCDQLAVFALLGSEHDSLARATVIACAVAVPSAAVLLIALQPSPARALGRLPAASPRVRALAAFVLAVAAVAAFVADRRLFVGLYPSAHLALRVACLGLASFALICVVRLAPDAAQRPALPARRRAWLLTPWLAAALAFVLAARDESAIALLTSRPWPELVIDAARQLGDFDRDGHGAWFAGGDCAPFDARVHPAASELPGNGRDDNCLLGDAAPRSAAPATVARAAGTRPGPVPLDLVLITIDSLRVDRVGAYQPRCGPDGLATTPRLDAWARDALRFEHAYTPGGWTSIALSALMRGRHPRALDWTPMFETKGYRLVPAAERAALPSADRATKMFLLPIADRHPALAEWLVQRGMRTIAVIDDGHSELLSPEARLAPGFQRWREVDALSRAQRGDSATVDLALFELASLPNDQRFFLWVHLFGPHTPNTTHAGVRRDGDTLEQGYEHEIRHLDAQLGRLLGALAARAHPNAVFVSADHGEEFIAGGRHHGWSLRDEVVRVPLFARVPGWPRGSSQRPVSLVDLMPTLCELSATTCPPGLDGRAIGGLLAAPASAASPRALFADTWRFDSAGRLRHAQSAAFLGDDKVLYQVQDGRWWRAHRREGAELWAPIAPSLAQPAVRALAAYVESGPGPSR